MNIRFELLTYKNFKAIRGLEKELVSDLVNYTISSDTLWLEKLLSPGNIVVGIFDEGRLIGFSSFCWLKDDPYKEFFLKKYKKYNIKEGNTLFFNNTLIHPKYRGLSLQRKVMESVSNKYKNFNMITTVSVENTSSIRSMKSIKLEVVYKGKAPYSKDDKYFFYGRY